MTGVPKSTLAALPVPARIDLVDEAVPMMLATLRSMRLLGPALDLFGKFPTLEAATVRLSWFITPVLDDPISDKPILSICLEAAIIAGMRAKGSGRNVRHAFLTAMLTASCILLEIDVRARESCWDPLFDAPLGVWHPAHGALHVNPHPPGDRALRPPAQFFTGLAVRLIEPEDLTDLPLHMSEEGRAA